MVTMPGEQMSQRRGVKREEAGMEEGQEGTVLCVRVHVRECVCGRVVAGLLHKPPLHMLR